MGRPARLDSKCPRCDSLERHRLLFLAIERGLIPLPLASLPEVLHFAAEPVLEKKFRERWENYRTADLFLDADLQLDIEAINLPDGSVDIAIASHVLEHVDDGKASRELNRVLRRGGVFICMVPIIEGWDETYENETVKSPSDRLLHFGQSDHVRFYGRDFPQRIERGGLRLTCTVTATPEDVVSLGLLRGEKIFVFRKG
jgi:SAM-dependent methyltransferase